MRVIAFLEKILTFRLLLRKVQGQMRTKTSIFNVLLLANF